MYFMKKENTKHVRSIVTGLIRKLESGTAKKANAVTQAWLGAINEKTRGHARPVSFKKGELVVVVENSTWLYYLSMEKGKIKEKINKSYPGRKKIEKIRFRVGKVDM